MKKSVITALFPFLVFPISCICIKIKLNSPVFFLFQSIVSLFLFLKPIFSFFGGREAVTRKPGSTQAFFFFLLNAGIGRKKTWMKAFN